MSKPLKLSHSALECFNQCNYKYYLKYVLRIKPYQPIRYPLVTGVAFHELVNEMYQECNFTRDFLVRRWKPLFNRCVEEEGSTWGDTSESKKYLDYGYILINQFFKFANENGYLIKPIHSEWAFSFNIGEMVIVGKTDIIIQRGPNMPVEVLDFKTAWKLPTQAQVDANKQLTLYDWAVKRELGYKDVIVGLFLPRKKTILISKRTEEDHAILMKELEAFDGKIKSQTFEPNLDHCTFCEFPKHCKFYKVKESTK